MVVSPFIAGTPSRGSSAAAAGASVATDRAGPDVTLCRVSAARAHPQHRGPEGEHARGQGGG